MMDRLHLVKLLTQNIKNLEVKPELVKPAYKYSSQSEPKDCFNNAFREMSTNIGATYILGYVFLHELPIEHAWIKHKDQHFDVTFPPEEQHTYFSVYELSLKDLMPFIEKHGYSPSIFDLNRFVK
jgi:hypothetical protein